jgi:hypothetical protein
MIEGGQGDLLQADWAATRGSDVRTADDAIRAVHGWNERKRRMFSPAHIRVAWDQLADAAWLPGGEPSAT